MAVTLPLTVISPARGEMINFISLSLDGRGAELALSEVEG
jgi:hypothetical protein